METREEIPSELNKNKNVIIEHLYALSFQLYDTWKKLSTSQQWHTKTHMKVDQRKSEKVAWHDLVKGPIMWRQEGSKAPISEKGLTSLSASHFGHRESMQLSTLQFVWINTYKYLKWSKKA